MNTDISPYAVFSYAGVYIVKWNEQTGRYDHVTSLWDVSQAETIARALNNEHLADQMAREVSE